MNNMKILSRSETLLKKMAKLQKQEEKLKKELDKVTDKCNHSIVVKFEDECEVKRTKVNREVCLFCRCTNPYKRKYVTSELDEKQKKTVYIEEDDYAFLGKKRRKVLEVLEGIYERVIKEFPDDTEEEIAKKVKEKLKNQNKE